MINKIKGGINLHINSFVSYLDQYNVLSPNHSKIYDEYTIDPDKSDTYSFTIRTKIEETLIQRFENNPQSIILTGNAGDGKTRLCRIVHDYFNEENLLEWPEEGIVDVVFSKGKIRIVKDLSELKEDIIYHELTNLQEYISNNHEKNVYYLIAANEGKLTKFLSQYEDLKGLRIDVSKRFKSHDNNSENFSIYNLLNVTSSVYVERVLEEWNKEENWSACIDCSMKSRCIINMNHERTSQPFIRNKLVEQYKLLDFLDSHITMREMLIHISYMLTGGYTCVDIFNADYKELEQQTKKPYYENFYGHGLDENSFAEMKALKVFKSLDPGLYSHSSVDDFIINGDINGDKKSEDTHRKLINDSLDLQLGYFKKKLSLYRDYDMEKDHKIINEWIPKLRRKYFYEMNSENEAQANQLLPFEYTSDYISMFNNPKNRASLKKDIINGLNRVFSGKLTEVSNRYLFATNKNLMIYEQFRARDINIEEEENREDLDRIPAKFKVDVRGEVAFDMNLAVFEFLMRASGGGTHNVLQQEAEILIDTFKNELIRISESDEYDLNILRYDTDSGLFIEDEISLL
ncbi:hypothetical protein P6709_09965 [Jeotgalibacillus sp. ET6]|uniref:hypothetical protein n=1 Tax=Jeotgalibacillus sp. ET6 TaxID=3037260 RepID=UPI00241859FA|nr:hypothetical protein [Jeotgalibacillus sp. ET6]MDG5472077.1 hypothetical protein [Jeotgalibacillus sp. ET6]